MQKLQKRLQVEGHDLKEVVEYAGNYGDWQASRRYNCGYLAMRRFLTEETGDGDYGTNPKYKPLTTTPGKTVVEEAMERIEHWIKNKEIALEEKVAQQNEYIKLLEMELKNYRAKQADDIEAGLIKLMEVCKV